jgi:hypothetical protein
VKRPALLPALASKSADTSIPDSFSYDRIFVIFAVFCEICFSFRAWKAQPGRFAYKALYAADLWSLRIEGL